MLDWGVVLNIVVGLLVTSVGWLIKTLLNNGEEINRMRREIDQATSLLQKTSDIAIQVDKEVAVKLRTELDNLAESHDKIADLVIKNERELAVIGSRTAQDRIESDRRFSEISVQLTRIERAMVDGFKHHKRSSSDTGGV